MSVAGLKELESLRNLESNYIKQLDYLPKLNLPLLLKECKYGALGYCISGVGYLVDNFVFTAHVGDKGVEYSIRIQHPDDHKNQYFIRHLLWKENGNHTYFIKSQFGKWDKHLDVAIEKVRDVQMKWVQGKLDDVTVRIAALLDYLQKEKESFESLFE